MEEIQSRPDFQRQNQLICESCKISFLEKDRIIDNLKRDLATQERKLLKLEEKALVQKENFASLSEGKV